ncbi:hypothetical protein CW689_01525 [Macrococcoides caseolyticum]|uniref:hypothetical protein n=1 Tax=Macrococcoides caseolyticum TaxID=69966 RepID=UPI000C341B71|nr:hypothetical protein [Macrococcus caseolyticus]PKE25173.1 hypothetical protein CW689_01525 [Macrococcus caseolyticus]
MININESKIKQFFLWLIAYIPIIALVLFKTNSIKEILKHFSFLKSYKIVINNEEILKGICFLLLLFFIYFYFAKIYLFFELKYTKNNKNGQIKSYKNMTVNEYSFFVLTLFMPLLFEDINNALDYMVFFTLIFLIIMIFTKTNNIIVNPIFLLTNLKVLSVEIENSGVRIKGYALVKNNIDLNEEIKYTQIFENVYYVFSQKDKIL